MILEFFDRLAGAVGFRTIEHGAADEFGAPPGAVYRGELAYVEDDELYILPLPVAVELGRQRQAAKRGARDRTRVGG